MPVDHPPIEWNYPEPQNALERFIGPGATKTEVMLQFIPPILAAFGFVAIALMNDWGWTIVQLIIAFAITLDMVGGVITNATSSAKRWYHRPGQGFNQHMAFVLLHILQPMLLVIIFDADNWTFAIGSFGYLLVASVCILRAPRYLQRPIALLALIIGIIWGLYGLSVPTHFEWFLPVYYTKLLVSHLLIEEPYRPTLGGHLS